MSRDRLFLLPPQFADPLYPDRRFFCPHGAQIDWLLASFPELAENIDVHYIGFERPREPVAALVGEENQSLPLLVLGDEPSAPVEAGSRGDIRFISDPGQILRALAERHGFPEAHP